MRTPAERSRLLALLSQSPAGRTLGDLAGIVAPGQNFKFRYEFGTDGSGGTPLGWFVDDAQLYTCQAAEPLFLDGFEVSNSARWSITAP